MHESLTGFDAPQYYEKMILSKAAGVLKAQLKNELEILRENTTRQTILIKRSYDNFYNTEHSEVKSSGIQRRSIPNFEALENAIRQKHHKTDSLILEHATLADQIVQFENANIIIAQHGTALANLIFAKPGTKVIEIITSKMIPSEYFSHLADTLGLDYHYYIQQDEHSPVNVEEIAALA